MLNFSASITVSHVGRNFHLFGKKNVLCFFASCNPGCWSGRSGCGAPGMGGASRSVSFPLPLPPPPLWEFPKIGVPQNGWFIMEKLIKMDDLGVPLFSETSFSTFSFFFWWISLTSADQEDEQGCSKVRIENRWSCWAGESQECAENLSFRVDKAWRQRCSQRFRNVLETGRDGAGGDWAVLGGLGETMNWKRRNVRMHVGLCLLACCSHWKGGVFACGFQLPRYSTLRLLLDVVIYGILQLIYTYLYI